MTRTDRTGRTGSAGGTARTSRTRRRRSRRAALASLPVALVVGALGVTAGAPPAGACGGLVGENGTIELLKTTTLAAYHDGVERYVTAFTFTGEGEEVGSIIPLPDVPTEVVRGGSWTLQRLVQEVTPPEPSEELASATADEAAGGADVILETQIDALDITVLRGGGDEVGEWAEDNGFLLTPDTPEVLDFYAERSPIFMAAKFDAERARELGQGAGDSTPIMATIPTDDPWVPLRILGLGLEEDQQVQADVFLLTDGAPGLLAGGPGVQLARSEPADDLLLSDLRSDEGMGWVPEQMWLSYLQVDAPAGDLDYDLAASNDRRAEPSIRDAGIADRDQVEAVSPSPFPDLPGALDDDDGVASWAPWLLFLGGGAALVAAARYDVARRRSRRSGVRP